MKYLLLFALISCVIIPAFARPLQKPHTLHKVTTDAPCFCQLAGLYETGFYLVDPQGNPLSNFTITPSQPATYGFGFSPKNDFNLLYALTCMVNSNAIMQVPKVAFIVGANGPANPNINIINFYGAKGSWKTVPGIGENFDLDFPKP